MYIRVENNLPCGSPQTLTDMRDGWVPFVKSDEDMDILTHAVSYVYDEDKNQVIETFSPVSDISGEILKSVRGTRDALLISCDWTQFADSPLTSTKKSQWATYRQALRDLPQSHSKAESLDDIIWPIQPE
jgi:hypothetical protein